MCTQFSIQLSIQFFDVGIGPRPLVARREQHHRPPPLRRCGGCIRVRGGRKSEKLKIMHLDRLDKFLKVNFVFGNMKNYSILGRSNETVGAEFKSSFNIDLSEGSG